jgi:hypothetical protein
MSRIQRISDRFPRFYKNWQRDSLIFSLLEAVDKQLDKGEEEVANLMKAHWVDTARRDELDMLGIIVRAKRISGEDDRHFRSRLKRAVNEYRGGGTVSAIQESVKELISAKADDIEIVENPPIKASAEFEVIANNTWTLGSDSIQDEQPSLTLTVEGKGQVSNPQIINTDTGESITFKGKLKTGEQLVMLQRMSPLSKSLYFLDKAQLGSTAKLFWSA